MDFFDLFYGTEIRRRHTDNFLAGFDRLAELAKGCDTDNIILDYIDHFGERLSEYQDERLASGYQVRANRRY